MATESTHPTVNGVYGGQFSQPAELAASTPSAPTHASSASQSTTTSATAPKADPQEIGWYFVEQYYTTLSKTPDRIHLFYSKKSQLVTGVEAEKVIPAVGTKAISEKIKALDIQDCKVRVLNVDSQASFNNIVVQVIGEMSNKSEPHHKFVQTFVLAEQPNGYFVLNDIFRYLSNDEDEIVDDEPTKAEVPVEEHATPEEPAAALPAAAEETVQTEAAVEEVDEKLEESKPAVDEDEVEEEEDEGEGGEEQEQQEEEEEQEVNGVEAPVAAEEAEPLPESTETTKDVLEEAPAEPVAPEQPADPSPTEAVPSKATTPAPAEAPPAKKTWASMVGGKAPAVPALPANPPAPAPAQSKPSRPAQQSQGSKASVTPAAPSTTSESATATTPTSQSNGWQTADHGKKAKGPQAKAGPEAIVLAYIKNVNDKVDARILREVLESFGELKYYDVSRPRNCAFVEFADPVGYAAAVAANPHQIGSEQIYVEERRPRAGAYGGSNTTYGRGNGTAGRGRGGLQGRSGSQGSFPKDAGRGGFQRGGKSGTVTPKGRGQGQAA